MRGKLAALLFVLSVGGSCSHIVFNETTYASLPPLHRLDDWAQCQAEEDTYCIVEAALVSNQPSQLFTLLQEFSKDTTRHFNRTQVHRGLCVSRCGPETDGPQPWHAAATTCLDRELSKYNLQAQVLSVDWCARPERAEASPSTRAFAAVVVALVALAVLASAVHVVSERYAKVEVNKFLLAFSLKRNWQILTYDRSKPRSDQRMKNLTSIEGMRVVAIEGVILTHLLLLGQLSFSSNPEFFEKMSENAATQLMLNSPLMIQAFFSMSAFLTTYSALITMDKNPITLTKCFFSVINRYIRLTPAAAILLWFTVSWGPMLGSGPQWAWFVEREARDCSERWWYHLLYAQNYLPLGKMCQGHTWYLAADMQLHIVGLLALLLLSKFRKAVVPVLTAMIVGSAVTAGLVAYFYQIRPIILGQTPEGIRSYFEGSKTVSLLYLPAWINLVGYASGMASAYIFHYTQVKGIKLNQNKWFNLLFHSAMLLWTVVLGVGVVFMRMETPRWAEVLYSFLDRPLVTVFFNAFLLGCVTKCKSGIRSMLEWRGFHVMGRLSYSVFLLHFTILRLTIATGTQLTHITSNLILNLLISATVVSYVLAIPFCLLFELPPIQLWKALTERNERPSVQDVLPQPCADATVKPLDLVANIRRRQEV